MEINLNIKKEKKTIKRWKLNNKEGWKKYNQQLKEKYNELQTTNQKELQDLMKRVMKQTVGQTTITIGS